MSIFYIILIVTSFILGLTYIIISSSRDRFLKYTEVNQYFAIGKLLNFCIFLIITVMMIFLISFEVSQYYDINQKNILMNKTQRVYFISLISLIIFVLSMAYLSISTNDLKGKPVYYIKNFGKQNQTLYILQQHKDKYICTYNKMDNPNRVIINHASLDGLEMEVYYKSSVKNLDFLNLLGFQSKILGTILFIFTMIILLCLYILFIGALFLLNYSLHFSSYTLILTTVGFSIFAFIYLLMIYITNFNKIKSKTANNDNE